MGRLSVCTVISLCADLATGLLSNELLGDCLGNCFRCCPAITGRLLFLTLLHCEAL